jgi:hypothetical protein
MYNNGDSACFNLYADVVGNNPTVTIQLAISGAPPTQPPSTVAGAGFDNRSQITITDLGPR